MLSILLCFSSIFASSYGFTLIKIPNCFVQNGASFATSSLSLRKDITTPSLGRTLTFIFATSGDRDDDNDWGSSSISSSESTDSTDLKRELEALKIERENKSGNIGGNVQSSQYSTNNNSTDQERDLFIPIFAIVSLAGLFGAYGYEMLRLNAQGELYLPWRQ